MEQKQTIPVIYAGRMSFKNMKGVDIGSLESHSQTIGFLQEIPVFKSIYDCYYAYSEDGRRIGSLMIVSEAYESEVLDANEPLGEFTVGLSGVVGFFSSPKTKYSMSQLGDYLRQLEESHGKSNWVELNTRQFMAPCSQAPATKVSVYAHRGRDGEIDAIQMEFNRKENDIISQAMKEAE